MTPLQKIIVVGAAAGVAEQIANLFPSKPTPEAVISEADTARILMAENKRKLKEAKRARFLK